MPNIIITETDFEKLSDDTKKELWDLLQSQFNPAEADGNSIDKARWAAAYERAYGLQDKIYEMRKKAKSDFVIGSGCFIDMKRPWGLD